MVVRGFARSVLCLIGLFFTFISCLFIIFSFSKYYFNISHNALNLNLFNVLLAEAKPECNVSKHWRTSFPNILPIDSMDIQTWGSYRPDVFFGMKSRNTPNSIVTGIAWNSAQRHNLRHKTEDITNFYWKRHDGRSFGAEIIIDQANNIAVDASFILINESKQHEKSMQPAWIQNIVIDSIHPLTDEKSLFFYIGNEASDRKEVQFSNPSSVIAIKHVHEHVSSHHHIISVGGFSDSSGNFLLQISIVNDQADDKRCVFDDETCSKLNPMKISYHGTNGRDSWTEIDFLGSEIERQQYTRSGSRQPYKYLDANGDLLNTLSSAASFMIVRVRTQTKCVVKATYYEHMKYKSKADFDKLAYLYIDDSMKHDHHVDVARKAFDTRFENTFHLEEKLLSPQDIELSKVVLSSLLGGIGFFHGSPEIGDGYDLSDSSDVISSTPESIIRGEPISLMSCTPSRTVFPRGFLWDEGFHQMLVSTWDPHLSLSMLSYWFNAMYQYSGPSPSYCKGGWIPREMILGDTGRSRVPQEFITQRVNIANPPTLLLVIENILNRYDHMKADVQSSSRSKIDHTQLRQDMKRITETLNRLYPAIDRWITWFINSQQGSTPEMMNSFRWRGRSTSDKKLIPNTLASGLDDYPRSFALSPGEAHVDLHAWMVKSCKIIARLGTFLGKDASYYHHKHDMLMKEMDRIHWSSGSVETETSRAILPGYYDIGLDHKMNRFEQFVVFRCVNVTDNTVVDIQVPKTVFQSGQEFCPASHPKPLYPRRDETGNPMVFETLLVAPPDMMVHQHIPRIGYVNIFPFILELISVHDDEKVNATLDMIENPDLLWTDFGLRSIAKTDMFYMKRNAEGDAPYWRGPIWICINFLTLRSLSHYKSEPSANAERLSSVYAKLRLNVMTSVMKSMKETGYLWEHYDDSTGSGTRGHPFSGWTALILNIIAEKY